MSSGSSGNVSPKGSSSSGSTPVTKKKRAKTSYPPPYWKEKVAKNHNVIKLLENNVDLQYALHKSPTLVGEFMKHPNVSREVARDKKLAAEIVRRPHLLQELANFHHYAHLQKRRDKVTEFVKKLEREYIKEHYNDPGGLVLPEINNVKVKSTSGLSVAIARATLPNIAISVDQLTTVKYIMKCSRLFLRHDVSIEHQSWCCLTKRITYYNVLNIHGRLMYRVFIRHKNAQQHFRPYEFVVKDPDGATVCVFTQIKDWRYRHKLAVQYPQNRIIGYVEQRWGCPFRVCPLVLKNVQNERMVRIACLNRPLLSYCRYHPRFMFELRAVGANNAIGKISTEWIDTPPGAFESERVYGVSFPRDLNTEVKITIVAAWILLYVQYFSGKFEKYIHHTLTDEERILLRLVEDSEDELNPQESREPSSNSDNENDEAVRNHYRQAFEHAALSAKNKKAANMYSVQDMNRNEKGNNN